MPQAPVTIRVGRPTETDRTEFGFSRTCCNCSACSRFCRHMPGALVQADLYRLMPPDANPIEWAKEHLRASSGSAVLVRGQVVLIPSLIPAQRADGSCHWLLPDGRCEVYEDAPFGCAFHDEHIPEEEHKARQVAAISDRMRAHNSHGAYAIIWEHLHSLGLVADSAANRRAVDEEGSRRE